MIVIGDAGGTNTQWRIIDDLGRIHQLQTIGLNVVHQSTEEYVRTINKDLEPYRGATQVHYYVAGLLRDSPYFDELISSLKALFVSAEISMANDLLAAARGLCGHQVGWIGILGTGANVAYYNSKEVIRKVPPLGYILGDEGSGSYLGKMLLKAHLRGYLSQELSLQLFQQMKMNESQLLSAVYRSENPKSFLAGLTHFLKTYEKTPDIYRLIYDSFLLHFDVFLDQKNDDLPIHYTGSVAFYFSDILRQAAMDRGISIGHIAEQPIAGLVLYHQMK